MKIRFPLYAKILGWFFLNLLLVAVVLYAVFRAQFNVGLDSLLTGEAGNRIQSVSEVIVAELHDRPRSEWDAVLARFSNAYRVKFYFFNNDGPQLAGDTIQLPSEVRAKILNRGTQSPPIRQMNNGERRPLRENIENEPPPPEDAPPPPEEFQQDSPQRPRPQAVPGQRLAHQKVMMRTKNPDAYWVLIRLPFNDPNRPRLLPTTLVAMSGSLGGNGLFFDFKPWLWLVCGVVLFSVLFWLPLIRGITRSVSRMKTATAEIAEGRFETRVNETRRDELGSLGGAINRMAARLAGFVTGQKRFLGDIAHELCSPIARMQMAVGILEERGDPKDKKYIADLREEVQEMSSLVNELLSFSKASLGASTVKLQPVPIRATVEKAVRREAEGNPNVKIEIDETLKAMAEPELLMRAVSNLLRNAIRYAGQSTITIFAHELDGEVELIVADNGAGVPESEIPKLFDPFYRVDTSRTRETGGAGLGLSIVKTCIETCRGTVTCRNRKPSGFEAAIRLPTN